MKTNKQIGPLTFNQVYNLINDKINEQIVKELQGVVVTDNQEQTVVEYD